VGSDEKDRRFRVIRMGQYFLLVNLDKKEYVHPHKIGCGLKLFEWCANKQAGVIPFLMAMCTDDGGAMRGRWAGDRVVLVGDYDDSELYHKAKREFTEISEWLIKAYNEFIEVKKLKLKEDEVMEYISPDIVIVGKR